MDIESVMWNVSWSDILENITSLRDSLDESNSTIWSIHSFRHMVATTIVLGVMVLSTIVGNTFVIAAVILERNLHGVANYLVVSLAIADLMVASLVMPISVVNEVSTAWFFSSNVCDMWISFDVLCCTASILHLLAISIDRYWAVTNIDYIRTGRSPSRIIFMIALAWVTALCISIPPLFGWRKLQNNPAVTGNCIISQDTGYTIFSTVGAFYLPMLAMMVIYLRIFQVARRTIRKKNFAKPQTVGLSLKSSTVDESAKSTTTTQSRPRTKILLSQASMSSIQTNEDVKVNFTNGSQHLTNALNGDAHEREERKSNQAKSRIITRDRHRDKLELKRERKAARTLGIITGCFIICWLPFFIVAVVAPFRDPGLIPPLVQSIVLWLGYLNSTLNPVIYTIFSPDFRGAFQKILCGKYGSRNKKRFSP